MCSSIFSLEHRWRTWLEISAYRRKTTTTKPQKRENNSPQERLMTGGFLETSRSRVCAEYFKHPGKRRRGAYLCTRCGTENTVHVFKSVSQVDVKPDRHGGTLRLTRFKVAQGPVWQVELGKRPSVFVMLNWAKESNWVGVRDWQCRLCLRARCGHFAGPIVHPPQ